RAVEIVDGAVVQQRETGAAGEGLAEQEVAVADDEIDGHAMFTQRLDGLRDARGQLGVVVVADPCFDQVAEDVHRIGGARLVAGEVVLEQARDFRTAIVQVQVGDEQRGHLSPSCRWASWPVRVWTAVASRKREQWFPRPPRWRCRSPPADWERRPRTGPGR